MDHVLLVAIIAIFMSGIIFALQRRVKKKYKFKEKQMLIKEKQKLITQLLKDNKDEAKKEIEKLQKEIMDISMDMMKANFKNMWLIMFISIFVFAYIAKFKDAIFPVGAFLGLSPVFVWYVVISLISNFILSIVFYFVDKKKE